MSTVYREKICYVATVTSEYYANFAPPTTRIMRLISNSEQEAKKYIEKYFEQRSRKILKMQIEPVNVLDLTDEVEVVLGTIGGNGTGRKRSRPNLDMYDGTYV